MAQNNRRSAFDRLIKLVLIGDSSVGKTCLLMRFADNRFPTDHMPTIGIDFKIKMFNVADQRVKLQLWDTAGQERFQTITTSYYKGAAGVLLVYDSTNKGTFNSIQNWLNQIEQNADREVLKILVANKVDVENLQVSEEEGRQLAQQYGLEFFACSAKTGQGVEEMFAQVCQNVIDTQKNKQPKAIQQKKQGASGSNGGINLDRLDENTNQQQQQNTKGNCC